MANKIICIGRQYGSGGTDISKLLSEKMGIPFYDKKLIDMASERSGIAREVFEASEEKKTNPWLYVGMRDANGITKSSLPPTDLVYAHQRELIIEKANEGPCIIVGRCSDAILKLMGFKVLSVFISAPIEDRIVRRMKAKGIDEKTAANLCRKNDRQRKAYYNYNTGLEWGAPENYDICINSSSLGIEGSADLIMKIYQEMD